MCGEPENFEHNNMSSRPPAGELPEIMISPISFLEISFFEVCFWGQCHSKKFILDTPVGPALSFFSGTARWTSQVDF